jgi:outer membrane lipoprotein-sorting protein
MLYSNDVLLNNIKNKYSSVKSFESEMTIKSINQISNEDFFLSGKIYHENKDFALEILEDIYQLFLYKNGSFSAYIPLYDMYLNEETLGVDIDFLSSNIFSKITEKLVFESSDKSVAIYNFSYKISDHQINGKIFVDINSTTIVEIHVFSSQGDAIIKLSNQKINQKLTKAINDFKIPDNK